MCLVCAYRHSREAKFEDSRRPGNVVQCSVQDWKICHDVSDETVHRIPTRCSPVLFREMANPSSEYVLQESFLTVILVWKQDARSMI